MFRTRSLQSRYNSYFLSGAVSIWSGVVAVPPTIENQTAPFGALTLASAGGWKPVDSNGDEVDLVSVDDQTGATRTWSVSSGRLIANGTPGVDDTVVLTCTTSLGVIEVTVIASGTDNGHNLADSYSFASLTEASTLSATSAATVAGKTFLARPGTYSGQLQFSGKAYGTRVTLSSHVPCFANSALLSLNSLRAKFTSSAGYTIEVLNTDNLTIKGLEVENTSINQGTDDCIRVRGPSVSDACIIEDNWIHGVERDPNGDYSAAGAYKNPTGISGDGNIPNDITIRRNYFSDLWVGCGLGFTGFARFQDNYLDKCYYDFTNWAQSATSTELTIERNVFTRPVGASGDADDPHTDCIQGNMLTGISPDDDWTGITISQNIIFIGNARGAITQGIFFGEDAGSNYVDDPIVKGNLFIMESTAHGITFEALNDGQFYNNTIVRQDTGAGGSSPGFQLGTTGSVPLLAGTQTMYGNIAETISLKSGATTSAERNITLGSGGVTIPYGDVFDGPTFTSPVETRTAALTRFSMLAHGEADIDDSGDASLYDAGAVGSGYSTFPTNILDSTGAVLDASYETAGDNMALVNLNTMVRWPGILGNLGSPSFVTDQSTLDASGEYLAYVFQAKEDMVISHVGFRPGTVAGSPTAEIRIETVGADGIPTGTLWDTNTNIVTGTLVTNTFVLSALTAAATITKGQFYAVKILFTSGTSIVVSRMIGPRNGQTNVPYTVTNVTGSAVKAVSASAHCIALGSSATAFYRLENSFPASAVTNSAYNNTGGARRGLRFQVPFMARVAGVAFYNSTSIGDFNATLRDDAGTELTSSSTAFEGDRSGASASAAMVAVFDNPIELTPDTWYRVDIEPTSADNLTTSVFTLPSADYRSAWPHGVNAHYTTYTTGGGWVDSATDQIPLIDLLVDQLGAPA